MEKGLERTSLAEPLINGSVKKVNRLGSTVDYFGFLKTYLFSDSWLRRHHDIRLINGIPPAKTLLVCVDSCEIFDFIEVICHTNAVRC